IPQTLSWLVKNDRLSAEGMPQMKMTMIIAGTARVRRTPMSMTLRVPSSTMAMRLDAPAGKSARKNRGPKTTPPGICPSSSAKEADEDDETHCRKGWRAPPALVQEVGGAGLAHGDGARCPGEEEREEDRGPEAPSARHLPGQPGEVAEGDPLVAGGYGLRAKS